MKVRCIYAALVFGILFSCAARNLSSGIKEAPNDQKNLDWLKLLKPAALGDQWFVYTAEADGELLCLVGEHAREEEEDAYRWGVCNPVSPPHRNVNSIWYQDEDPASIRNLLLSKYRSNEQALMNDKVLTSYSYEQQKEVSTPLTNIKKHSIDAHCCANPGECSITDVGNTNPNLGNRAVQVMSCDKSPLPTTPVYFQLTKAVPGPNYAYGYSSDCYVGDPNGEYIKYKQEPCVQDDRARWTAVDPSNYKNVLHPDVIINIVTLSARRVEAIVPEAKH